MGRFINPFTDTGFKRLFGQEFSKPILISFLNELLHDERAIVDLHYLDKEQIGVYDGERSLIYDVLCETDTGEKIIVEMQNRYQPFFRERSIYYAARAIVEQGQHGRQWEYDLKAVYLVAFMDFQLSDGSRDFRIDVALMDMERHTLFSDKVRMVYLQLPFFTKEEDACVSTFDRMIYVLKHMDVFDRMPWAAKNSVFERMAEIAEVARLGHDERIQYEADLKSYRDTLAVMHGQYLQGEEKGKQQGFEQGLEQGLEQGMKQGLEQGLAQGIAQGREQGSRQASYAIARKLKSLGIPATSIVEATGLTAEEIGLL